MNIKFENFVIIYKQNIEIRIKENSMNTKVYIIDNKILPYFKNKKINEISNSDILQWQNSLKRYRDKNGKPYSQSYLKTIQNQLSAIFNHAIRFYNLKSNPAAKVGNMSKAGTKEMKFWTKDEYLKFADSMRDKPISYYAFEMLYWTGTRLGELLALTKTDFNFKNKAISINKSYQRIKPKDIITEPKTPKSNRIIKIPSFLCEKIEDYFNTFYGCKTNHGIFHISKDYLYTEMTRGSKEQN